MKRPIALIVLGYVLASVIHWAAGAAQSVTLAWNPNSETNLAGYRLYWGTGSRGYQAYGTIPTGTETYTVTNINAGTKYYFAVTAFTDDGLESDYSDEVSYLVPEPPKTKTIVLHLEQACDLLGPWDRLTNVTTIVVPDGSVFYRGVIEIK